MDESQELPKELQDFQLIFPTNLDQDTTDRIIEITKNVPRPHPILKELTRELTTEELYELIASDAEVTAKILQTINSAAFFLEKEIISLSYAMLYLGMNLVKDIAFKVALGDEGNYTPRQSHAFENIWAAGFLGSCITTYLARNLGLKNITEIATQTVLCLIGDIAIVSYQPHLAELYTSNMPFLERLKIEQDELNTNAALIGANLAQEWQLPNTLIERIRYSLTPLTPATTTSTLSEDDLRSVIVSYIASRISDFIILQNAATKLDQYIPIDASNPSFFYLAEHLKLANLSKIESIINAPAFKKEINNFIEKIIK